MTLKEAIASGKPFKREGDENYYYFGSLVLINDETSVAYLKSVADNFETDFQETTASTAMIPKMTDVEFQAMLDQCRITGQQATDLRTYFTDNNWLSI